MFKIGDLAAPTCDASADAASKAGDEELADELGIVVGALHDLGRVELDLRDVLGGELAAIEDEEDFIALVWVGRPVDDEHAADRGFDAELFRDLAGRGLCGGLTWAEVAARDVPAGSVRGANQEDAAGFVEEEHSGGRTRVGYGLDVLGLGHPPSVSGCGD
jgi:hypothetical protein